VNHLCTDSPQDKTFIPNCMTMCGKLAPARARCQVFHCFESKSPTAVADHASHCGHATGRVGGGSCAGVRSIFCHLGDLALGKAVTVTVAARPMVTGTLHPRGGLTSSSGDPNPDDNFASGEVTVFDPYNGPCYRCLLPEPPPAELAPSCAEAGVLGVLPGIIGSIQALEAIKLILDLGDPLRGRLLAYDALDQTFRSFKVRRDPECPACGENARTASAAALFSVVIHSIASVASPLPASTRPVPSGFVRKSASPGCAPDFGQMPSGWTVPTTASPYLGSSSRIVCPPASSAPAARTCASAAAKSSAISSTGRSSGKAAIESATSGIPSTLAIMRRV